MELEHPGLATDLNDLAMVYTARRYAEAEPLYERVLAIWEKAHGPDHPNVAKSLENYAALLRDVGRGAGTAEMEARAEAIRAKLAEGGQ